MESETDIYRFFDRLRLIYVPVLSGILGFVAVYAFFDWLLTMHTQVLALDDEVTGFWLPFTLPIAPAWLWLGPRLKGLKLGDTMPIYFTMLIAAAMIAPAMIAHSYLSTATGALTHVAKAGELGTAAVTKYYATDELCITKADASVDTSANVTGRYNETLEVHLYVVVPLCAMPSDPATRAAWVGIVYNGSIDNNLSDKKKDERYKAFLDESQKKFDAENPAAFTYLERVGNLRRDQKGFESALGMNTHYDKSQPSLILVPHTDAFVERNGSALDWLIGVLVFDAVALGLMVFLPGADAAALARIRSGARPAATEPPREPSFWYPLLVPSRESYGLPLLIDINAAVYIAMVLAGLGVTDVQTDDLLDWGAAYRPYMSGLGYFRLLTCQFVHAGLMHVANNLYGLLIAGVLLRPVLGEWRLILAYLLAGLGGSIASVATHPDTVSVGASGAIFGLYGITLVLLLMRDPRIAAERRFIIATVPVFVVLNLVFGLASPGIDNAAHIGGLFAGVVLGFLVYAIPGASLKARPEI